MRKKSTVQTVQKWVDSISLGVDEEDNKAESEKQINCDNSELNVGEQPSTSSEEPTTGVKGKLTEICNKLNVNEKLKSKKVQEFKNLLAKTTQKIKEKNKVEVKMEQNEEKIVNEDEKSVEEEEEINESNTEIRRCHLGTLGRSVSESPRPPPRTRRLTDIGRSFSVAHDNELPTNDSSDNLIYDVDDDTSLAIPSPKDSSPSVMSNSQLDRNLSGLRPPERRMHTVSEGHYSPHVLPKNQLLRDCSFQVSDLF